VVEFPNNANIRDARREASEKLGKWENFRKLRQRNALGRTHPIYANAPQPGPAAKLSKRKRWSYQSQQLPTRSDF